MLDSQTVVSVLVWAFVTVSTGLVFCLVWFAMRVVAQLDRLEGLVTDEIHALDVRVSKLESWKDGVLDKFYPRDHNNS